MKQNKANVVFFIFNRPVHTETTLTELLKQKNRIETLYINVDFPDTKEDRLLQNKTIKAVEKILERENISNVKWLKSEENLGIAKSVVGTTTHLSQYDKNLPIIVIEDDCVPLPGFMDYMIHYLTQFKYDSSVYTVCAYQYKEDEPVYSIKGEPIVDVEKTRRFNPWGWGFWPHKWDFKWLEHVSDNELMYAPPSVREFIRHKEFQNGKIDIWSTTVVFKQFFENLHTIVPTISLIENIGFDGTGVHSEITDVFTKESNIKTDPIIMNRDSSSIRINEKREELIEEFLMENLGKVMFKKEKQ